eukprot:197794_1
MAHWLLFVCLSTRFQFIFALANISNSTVPPESFNTTSFYSFTTSLIVEDCSQGFKCAASGDCINITSICDGTSHCPNHDDEPEHCTVCIGDISERFGGSFQFFSYDVVHDAFIYKNSINDYYLYPSSTGYDIGLDYNDEPNWEFTCFIHNKSSLNIANCAYWLNSSYHEALDIFIDIGCSGCGYRCFQSGLCMKESQLCDDSTDCILNDDETWCNICFHSHDLSNSYLDGEYSFNQFDTTYNGSIYYDGSYLYMYPKIDYDPLQDQYYYYYFINEDYHYQSTFAPLAVCAIGHTDQLFPYYTMRVTNCGPWAFLDFDATTDEYFIVNVSSNRCVSIFDTTAAPTTTTTETPILTNSLTPNTTVIDTIIPHWVTASDRNITFYVSANGSDVAHCGTETYPCGTLWYATNYIFLISKEVSTIQDAILIIRGQNEQIISQRCAPQLRVELVNDELNLQSFTFEFDPHFVSSKNDWFPLSTTSTDNAFGCEHPSPWPYWPAQSFFGVEFVSRPNITYYFSVYVNNCVINDWVVTEDTNPKYIADNLASGHNSHLELTYVFNNLTFRNNTIIYFEQPLIIASHIEIYESVFVNNTFHFQLVNDSAIPRKALFSNPLFQSFERNSFIMKRTEVRNMHFMDDSAESSFVYALLYNESHLSVDISHNIIDHTSIAYGSWIEFDGGTKSHDGTHLIIIQNNRFVNTEGNILTVNNVQHGLFVIDNLTVSTSEMTEPNSTSYLFIVDLSELSISNIYIEYNIADSLVDHCSVYSYMGGDCVFGDVYTEQLDVNASGFITYSCEIPIPFIRVTFTKMNLTSIHVYSDITQSSLQNTRNHLFQRNTWLCNINDHTPALFTYLYNTNSAFCNVQDSNVTVNRFELYGVGASSLILSKYDGNVKISQMVSHYDHYCADDSSSGKCSFDPYALNIGTYVLSMGSGRFDISNSSLYGAYPGMLELYGGVNYVMDSIFEFALYPIWSFATEIWILNCHMRNVGLGPYYMLPMSNRTATSATLGFETGSVWIQDSHVEITDHTAMAMFLDCGVTLINNTFMVRDGNDIDFNMSVASFQSKGLIHAMGNVQMNVVYNNMSGALDPFKRSLFYLDTSNTTCFGGNVLTSARIINLEQGIVTSCFIENMVHVFQWKDKCYYSSVRKTMRFHFEYNDSIPFEHWIAIDPQIPIIQITDGAVFLDSIIIDEKLDHAGLHSEYLIMNINMGHSTLFFMNLIVPQRMHFAYDKQHCDIICYDILKQKSASEQYITQLRFECNVSDENAYLVPLSLDSASFIDHTTPYYIYFLYEHQYIVDSDLIISLNVLDRFENVIKDYSGSISIQFINHEIAMNDIVSVNASGVITLHPSITNEHANQNLTITTIANEKELISMNHIDITIIPFYHLKRVIDPRTLYLLFLLLPLCIIIIAILMFVRHQYMSAFIVDKALVLIIGVSQFVDKEFNLKGVGQNVSDLLKLWQMEYNYDVFVCKNTLYCTKQDVYRFLDEYNTKLEDTQYRSVIVHVISHGSADAFTTSDLKEITLESIRHEINTSCKHYDNAELIKLIFHHGCRGGADHHIPKNGTVIQTHPDENTWCCGCSSMKNAETIIKSSEVTDANKNQTRAISNLPFRSSAGDQQNTNAIPFEANCLTMYGNIVGRVMSDAGHFTKCICSAFQNNLSRSFKADFNSLTVEIGRALEQITNGAELCSVAGTVRYNQIRFERCKDQSEANVTQIELQQTKPLQITSNGQESNRISESQVVVGDDEINRLIKDLDEMSDSEQYN